MKIEFKLFDNEKETPEGYPLVIMFTHQRNRKRKNIAFCKSEHFIQDHKTINEKHPIARICNPCLPKNNNNYNPKKL
jgi:hypothetical protein